MCGIYASYDISGWRNLLISSFCWTLSPYGNGNSKERLVSFFNKEGSNNNVLPQGSLSMERFERLGWIEVWGATGCRVSSLMDAMRDGEREEESEYVFMMGKEVIVHRVPAARRFQRSGIEGNS